jgi:hypothetical protein
MFIVTAPPERLLMFMYAPLPNPDVAVAGNVRTLAPVLNSKLVQVSATTIA